MGYERPHKQGSNISESLEWKLWWGLSTSIVTRPQEDGLTQPGTGDMVGDILSVPCVSFRLLCCFPL